jgi:hypothetical protein
MQKRSNTESVIRDIRRQTRKKYPAEEKIRVVIDDLTTEEMCENHNNSLKTKIKCVQLME